MKCSITAFILLGVAIAAVQCYGPPRPRPMRRNPPHRHTIVSRRDPAFIPGPPYSKRPMSNMMISHPNGRPKKHAIGPMSHYPKYSPSYNYPPPPYSRPYSMGPPKKSFYNPRPYGAPSKYPYYGKHPGYPGNKYRPNKVPYEDVPKETIPSFVHSPSSAATFNQGNYFKGGAKVPTITYGSPSIASKPYNLYGSSEEHIDSEEYHDIHQVGASIKYGKNKPGAGPAHPALLDPSTNIKYPGPTFKFPQQNGQNVEASNKYQTIQPTQPTYYNNEQSMVKYPADEPSQSQSSTYRKRRPQRQDASKATVPSTARPYTPNKSNVKFPAANTDAASSSYQNYDHFLQETFAPDLGSTHHVESSGNSGNTRQQQQPKRDRTKSRYRTPSKQQYEVRDEPEERGDVYDDIETVDSDYEGWQPSDSK